VPGDFLVPSPASIKHSSPSPQPVRTEDSESAITSAVSSFFRGVANTFSTSSEVTSGERNSHHHLLNQHHNEEGNTTQQPFKSNASTSSSSRSNRYGEGQQQQRNAPSTSPAPHRNSFISSLPGLPSLSIPTLGGLWGSKASTASSVKGESIGSTADSKEDRLGQPADYMDLKLEDGKRSGVFIRSFFSWLNFCLFVLAATADGETFPDLATPEPSPSTLSSPPPPTGGRPSLAVDISGSGYVRRFSSQGSTLSAIPQSPVVDQNHLRKHRTTTTTQGLPSPSLLRAEEEGYLDPVTLHTLARDRSEADAIRAVEERREKDRAHLSRLNGSAANGGGDHGGLSSSSAKANGHRRIASASFQHEKDKGRGTNVRSRIASANVGGGDRRTTADAGQTDNKPMNHEESGGREHRSMLEQDGSGSRVDSQTKYVNSSNQLVSLAESILLTFRSRNRAGGRMCLVDCCDRDLRRDPRRNRRLLFRRRIRTCRTMCRVL
jgi:hypothetical protein